MKLHFDSDQQYQIDAVQAVVDIFKGQPLDKGTFEVDFNLSAGKPLLDFALSGNNLLVAEETILDNVKKIQKRNGIKESETLDGLHFSVEMETGTGKTYVYFRTIHELHKKYGFKKFIIVVPSIAIKEGGIKNFKITKEHFDTLYDKPAIDFCVYDSKKRAGIKSFARTNTLQILLINIDSFTRDENIINKDSDWGKPIEEIQKTHPIVIVDEPQNMETKKRKKAIENLKPLCTLRYSATHKHLYNLVYKLDPVQAYDLGLVKRIEVDSIITTNNYNEAFIEIISVKSTKTTITARLKIDINTLEGIKRRVVTIKKTPRVVTESDLYRLSNKREVYQDGYIVSSVDVSRQSVTFSNGRTVYVGQVQGGLTDDILKYQIKETVYTHFEKERQLKEKGIKVLSLFFIDRVANYREYDAGGVQKGKLAVWFEEAFEKIKRDHRYVDLIPYPVEKVHNGYFSCDKKGVLKDTKGESQADNDTYSLIMRDKERLLSINEPLRFIFSHSALREGWDNPNVFQICTLNETQSNLKKRQEIGRGLRLPISQDGRRVFDQSLNILTVIANESYDDFARRLQTEIEDECHVNFEGRIKDKQKRKRLKLKKAYRLDPEFKALWDKIKHKTRYRVKYDTAELIEKVGDALSAIEIHKPKISSMVTQINITKKGVDTTLKKIDDAEIETKIATMPNIVGYIQDKTRMTKETIHKIIRRSGHETNISQNPQQFVDTASAEINQQLNEMMVDGIKYEKIAGQEYEMALFENEELSGYLEDMVKVQNQEKTLYDYVLIDSEIERRFAADLESLKNAKFYIKLPYWFKIKTPIGDYNPDWAVVFENDKRIYFVAETKGTTNLRELRGSERIKMQCGKKHFEEFDDVAYKLAVKVQDLFQEIN